MQAGSEIDQLAKVATADAESCYYATFCYYDDGRSEKISA